jgi:hypothetical protein
MKIMDNEYRFDELARESGRLVWFAIAAYCLLWVFLVLVEGW